MSSTTYGAMNAVCMLLRMQRRPHPAQLQLDTRIHLPKDGGHMNGKHVGSWFHNLPRYLYTHPTMEEVQMFQITSLQQEGLTHTWWDTQLENQALVIEIGEP